MFMVSHPPEGTAFLFRAASRPLARNQVSFLTAGAAAGAVERCKQSNHMRTVKLAGFVSGQRQPRPSRSFGRLAGLRSTPHYRSNSARLPACAALARFPLCPVDLIRSVSLSLGLAHPPPPLPLPTIHPAIPSTDRAHPSQHLLHIHSHNVRL